ncbi:hypothetical protein AFGD_006009 [Aspergillus flavus]|nr:hypothetical protein AFGD_006009 [Aspergillus flavus]
MADVLTIADAERTLPYEEVGEAAEALEDILLLEITQIPVGGSTESTRDFPKLVALSTCTDLSMCRQAISFGDAAARLRPIYTEAQRFNTIMRRLYHSQVPDTWSQSQIFYTQDESGSRENNEGAVELSQAQAISNIARTVSDLLIQQSNLCTAACHTALVLLNGFTQPEIEMLMSVCGDKNRPRWNIVSWSKDDPCKYSPQTGEHTDDICAVLKRSWKYKTRLRISVRKDGTWTYGSTSTEDRMESNAIAPTLRLRELLHGGGDGSGGVIATRLLKKDKLNLAIAVARSILCLLGTPMMHDGLGVEDIYIAQAADPLGQGALSNKPYITRALDHMSTGASFKLSGEGHPYILKLGVLLWELLIGKKITINPEDEEDEDGVDSNLSLFNALNREEINSREICVEKPILDVIANCLNIYPQTQLDERMVRSVVYWNIVKPLQNYLDSLYTTRARASTLHRKRPANDMTSNESMMKSEDFGSPGCRQGGLLALEPRTKRVKEDDPGPQWRKQERRCENCGCLLTPESYAIGIVCALHKELLAVRILFDCTHESIPVPSEDSNHYSFGRMGQHDIVAVCLPSGEYGTNSAANAIANMRRSFPAIRFCLLVGIGAGVPTEQNDLRLGDVVVSHPTGTHPGVIQYDLGKQGEDGVFHPTGSLQRPPRFLLTAISHLISNPDLSPAPLQGYVDQIIATRPDYKRPDEEKDTIFDTGTVHITRNGIREHHYADGEQQSNVSRRATHPHIHYGLIASGNRVMKSASARDHLASVYNILCFEMEAAGVMNICPCLVIRGICDYADCHKNDLWQNYASATAAAYAKLLLTVVRP